MSVSVTNGIVFPFEWERALVAVDVSSEERCGTGIKLIVVTSKVVDAKVVPGVMLLAQMVEVPDKLNENGPFMERLLRLAAERLAEGPLAVTRVVTVVVLYAVETGGHPTVPFAWLRVLSSAPNSPPKPNDAATVRIHMG